VSVAHEEAIYWIVREALATVGKHARAREVTISVSRGKGDVWARIEDDAIGLPHGDPAFHSFDLRSMRERVKMVHRMLWPGKRRTGDTAVYFSLPIPGDEPVRWVACRHFVASRRYDLRIQLSTAAKPWCVLTIHTTRRRLKIVPRKPIASQRVRRPAAAMPLGAG
jgi:hypothetical protein